jgi:hypothetical protein
MTVLATPNMLIETTGGFDYTGEDCQAWMRKAGYSTAQIDLPIVA